MLITNNSRKDTHNCGNNISAAAGNSSYNNSGVGAKSNISARMACDSGIGAANRACDGKISCKSNK